MENCPITGKPCNKAKNVYVQKQENGQVTDFYCCNECVGEIHQPFLHTLLHTLGVLNSMQPEMPRCKCGSSLQDIKSKGIGCPDCYTTFKDQLSELVFRVQYGGFDHQGKTPKFNLESLKTNMQKAIQEERYEDAATYRDRIKSLETLNRN
jgi:protein arginine kinase activator